MVEVGEVLDHLTQWLGLHDSVFPQIIQGFGTTLTNSCLPGVEMREAASESRCATESVFLLTHFFINKQKG